MVSIEGLETMVVMVPGTSRAAIERMSCEVDVTIPSQSPLGGEKEEGIDGFLQRAGPTH